MLYHAVQLLFDLPFVLLSPFALWRLPAIAATAFAAPFGSLQPQLRLRHVRVSLPAEKSLTGSGTLDGHGVVISFRGVKPTGLALRQAYLRIVNEPFWLALAHVAPPSLVSAFRLTMHPLALCPAVLDPEEFTLGNAEVDATLQLGTGQRGTSKISHTTILKVLVDLISKGNDAVCVCRLEYVGAASGEKGALFDVALQPSQLLQSHSTSSPQDALFLDADSIAASQVTASASAAPQPAPALSSLAAPLSSSTSSLFACALDASTANTSASALRAMVAHQVLMVLLDLLSLLTVLAISLIPWRCAPVWRAVFQDITNLHAVAHSHAKLAGRFLLVELTALLLCTLCFWNLRKGLSLLFTDAASLDAQLQAKRRHLLWKRAGKCCLDLFILALLAAEIVTLWRLPFLLSDLSTLFRFVRDPTRRSPFVFFPAVIKNSLLHTMSLPPSVLSAQGPSKLVKLQVGAVIIKQFLLFVLDVAQCLELVYVLFTLVQVPELCHRTLSLLQFSRDKWRVEREGWARMQQATRTQGTAQTAAVSLLDVLPHESALFPFLSAKELCACAEVHFPLWCCCFMLLVYGCCRGKGTHMEREGQRSI